MVTTTTILPARRDTTAGLPPHERHSPPLPVTMVFCTLTTRTKTTTIQHYHHHGIKQRSLVQWRPLEDNNPWIAVLASPANFPKADTSKCRVKHTNERQPSQQPHDLNGLLFTPQYRPSITQHCRDGTTKHMVKSIETTGPPAQDDDDDRPPQS